MFGCNAETTLVIIVGVYKVVNTLLLNLCYIYLYIHIYMLYIHFVNTNIMKN